MNIRMPFATAIVVLCTLAPPLRAQSVYGVVRLAADSSPAAGALVVLDDSSGTEQTRAFTGANGRFVLRTTRAGTYRLKVLRIGFRPWQSPPLALAEGKPREFSPLIPDVPVTLPSITVTGESRCGAPSQSGAFMATLWEQATTALSATAWAIEHHRFRFRATEFGRQLNAHGDEVSVEPSELVAYSAWPFEALSADSLVNGGFVQEAPGGPVYFAPDATVLFSAPFLNTHCFRVRASDPDHAGEVGLAFRPVDARRPRDIEGTLWIDKATLVLRSLDFEYTSLGIDIRGATAGGSIDFERLPDGAWAIRRWQIRAPIAEYSRGFYHPRLGGYKVRGGEVIAIYTADGTLIRKDADTASPGP